MVEEDIALVTGVALIRVKAIARKRSLLQPHTAGVPIIVGKVEIGVIQIPSRGRDSYGIDARTDGSPVQVDSITLPALHRINLPFVGRTDHVPLLVYAAIVSATVDSSLVVITSCAECRAGARSAGVELDNMANGRIDCPRFRGHCGDSYCKCHRQSHATGQDLLAQGFHHVNPPFHGIFLCKLISGRMHQHCAPVLAITSRGRFPGAPTLSCN